MFLIVAAQTRIDLHEKGIVGPQSCINRSHFPGASNEKRGGCDQLEGEGEWHHDERIARQKFSSRPMHVLVCMSFQISYFRYTLTLESWTKRNAQCFIHVKHSRRYAY